MTMIEQVARALFVHNNSIGWLQENEKEQRWQQIPANSRKQYCNRARAAIEAMREPTEAMAERGEAVRGNHDSTWSGGNSTAAVFSSMIDSALSEVEQSLVKSVTL